MAEIPTMISHQLNRILHNPKKKGSKILQARKNPPQSYYERGKYKNNDRESLTIPKESRRTPVS